MKSHALRRLFSFRQHFTSLFCALRFVDRRPAFREFPRNTFLIALTLLLSGCAGSGPHTRIDPSMTAERLVHRLRSNAERIQTLRGRGRLIVEMPGANFAGHAKILVKKPDSLFILAKAIFGVEVGFFFADRHRFSSYSPLENTFYSGPTDRMHELILFEMKIPYDQLLNTLLGTVDAGTMPDSLRLRIDDDAYVLIQPWDGRWLLYRIDPAKSVVIEVLLVDDKGRIEAKQTFSRFRKKSGVWLPQMVRLQRPPTRERLTIWYEDIEINTPIAADEFAYKVPENARQVLLNEAMQE